MLGVAGTGAWYLAKAVKPLVGRGHPVGLIAGAKVRGSQEGDLGFPSGHAAVSTALTVVLWPGVPPAGRRALAGLCGIVSFARLYVGAHLPLDVVVGSALGLAVGSAITALTTRKAEPQHASPPHLE
jgi:undecaprenyl-diphosphatase